VMLVSKYFCVVYKLYILLQRIIWAQIPLKIFLKPLVIQEVTWRAGAISSHIEGEMKEV
jgi:hypothetical protein